MFEPGGRCVHSLAHWKSMRMILSLRMAVEGRQLGLKAHQFKDRWTSIVPISLQLELG